MAVVVAVVLLSPHGYRGRHRRAATAAMILTQLSRRHCVSYHRPQLATHCHCGCCRPPWLLSLCLVATAAVIVVAPQLSLSRLVAAAVVIASCAAVAVIVACP